MGFVNMYHYLLDPTPYSRHTYATLLLLDHYSPAYVQKQLGIIPSV
jgi:hypothetical protein